MQRIIFIAAAVLLTASPAAALTQAETELALAVAQVSANEASLEIFQPAELALIWQVTEGHGTTARERLAWLRRHSSCVLTDRPMSPREHAGNCRWSRHLEDNDRRPEGFTGPWRFYIPAWRRIRDLAKSFVSGANTFRPCVGNPDTWGGPMDHAGALDNGLRPLECFDERGERTRNRGYERGSRSRDQTTDLRLAPGRSPGRQRPKAVVVCFPSPPLTPLILSRVVLEWILIS